MQPTPESSNVQAAEYDQKAGVLRVQFRSGPTYEYEASPATAKAFWAAPSKGSFVHKFLAPKGARKLKASSRK